MVSVDAVFGPEDAGESMFLGKEAFAIGRSINQETRLRNDLMDWKSFCREIKDVGKGIWD